MLERLCNMERAIGLALSSKAPRRARKVQSVPNELYNITSSACAPPQAPPSNIIINFGQTQACHASDSCHQHGRHGACRACQRTPHDYHRDHRSRRAPRSRSEPAAAIAIFGNNSPENEKRAELFKLYGEQRFLPHSPWLWKTGELIPHYQYQPVITVADVWTEWTQGLNGYLPVSELTSRWETRWRRNNAGMKTEGGRRKKIITLIDDLSRQPGWSAKLALDFLRDKYGPGPHARAFADRLTKNRGVINASALYMAARRQRAPLN